MTLYRKNSDSDTSSLSCKNNSIQWVIFGGANLIEVIVGQGEIPIVAEKRNLTNVFGNTAVEFVVSDFNGQETVELVPEEENFGEVGCVTDTLGNRADEVVVGESEIAGRRGAEILGEALCEVVVVNEDDVEILLEELKGNWAGKFVEAEIEED
ncbi:uncharacterized protein HKW66_Vig0240740 [Vigna angularis]|uniref:Uncharacterized protein n=1 Tax=Phaseolus angularis TaxID=3914 RepID=A0A8T0JJ29_PHAAN|nr:uncharacterized protein HKW66_Vig0240740 [Vigna angularis]